MSQRDWVEHMRRGEFDAAWRISDDVLHARRGRPCWHLPRHEQYVWDGTALDGRRVLVRCYHGLGDTIQFARYASPLRAVAREVVLWVQPELLPLLRSVDGVDRLLPLHDGAPDVSYDVDVEIMELPHVFRTARDAVPAPVPYLHVDPAPRPRDGRLHVGVVWSAGGWDERRSFDARLLAPLADVPGVTLHALQRGAPLARWSPAFGPIGGADEIPDLARAMRALDLVVTVDSMPAHLAGALGCPVWTLLHADADWRWMRDVDRSPWYPTMRLFRQPLAGAWEPVIRDVAHALEAWS